MKETIKFDDREYKYNERRQSYDTNLEIAGKNIEVVCKISENLEENLKRTSKYIAELDVDKLKRLTINEDNYDEHDMGVSKDDYLRRISLRTIRITRDYVEYWFNDDDIFGGHDIVLTRKHTTEEYDVTQAG